jgi:L-amino acid N-acyltransferase YncA
MTLINKLSPINTDSLVLNEKYPIVTIYAYAHALKKRARREDRHSIELGTYLANDFYAMTAHEKEQTLAAMAEEKLRAGFKTWVPNVVLAVSHGSIKIEETDGVKFECNEMMLFDERNFNLNVEIPTP